MPADAAPEDGNGDGGNGNRGDGMSNHGSGSGHSNSGGGSSSADAGGGAGVRKPIKLTTKEILIKGSIIGAIVTVPSLVAFFVSWIVLDDVMLGAISAAVIHFIAMGLSLKMSRRLLGWPVTGASGSQPSSGVGRGG